MRQEQSVHPPETQRRINLAFLDPGLRGTQQVEVDDEHQETNRQPSVTPRARLAARQGHCENRKYDRRERYADTPLQLRAVQWIGRAHQRANQHLARLRFRWLQARQPVRDTVLRKLDDAELRRSRDAFVTAPVVQDEEADVRVIRFHLFAALRHDDLDDVRLTAVVLDEPLQKDVLHEAVGGDALAIDDRPVRPEDREPPRFDAREIRLAARFRTDTLDGLQSTRPEVDREPRHAEHQRQGQPEQRPIDAGRPDAASHHRRHFAVAIQAAEGQHDGQEQADRHQHRQVLNRREADDIHCRALGQFALCDLTEDPGELVGEEDHQQHDRDREPGCRDFPKQVPIEDAQHRCQ
jgi:hypothetical protein